MSFIYSFQIIKVVPPEPCIFFWIPASIAEADAAIPKTFFAKGIHFLLTFINGPTNLRNNDPKKSSRLNYFRNLCFKKC